MTAPARPVTAPAQPVPLPHPVRYPLAVDGIWRAGCQCHWWQPLGPVLGVTSGRAA